MRRIALAAATVLALLVSVLVYAQPAQAAVGIRISNGRLVEANGTPLILRGVNHAHTWFKSQTSSFAAIKAAGANAVRVVLSGGRWQPADTAADVANVINLCKTNRLICVLENHDTTGFNEQGGAVSLDASVNYWISIQSALTGQENFVILNIGNEPMGNGSNPAVTTWPTATSNAIQRLRSAGFDHTIMVDAPNWGQDWQFVMRDNAPTVFAADPDRNTIFSIHMYGVFDTAAEITAYLDSFVSRGLPLVVGEFGWNHSDGDPDEDTIFAATQARNLGWMAWSWSGNGCCVEYLDMVQNNNGVFNHTVRSDWGNEVIDGINGLRATAREATIYSGGGGGDTTPPSTPGTPTASNVTSTGATLTWAASTDTGGSGLAGYTVFREQGATDPQLATSTTNTVTLTGLTPNTQYQVYIRARDGAGNQSANSALATFTTPAGTGDTTPPTTPGTPSVSNVTSTGATLTWTASTDNVGVTGYTVFREQGTTDPQLATSTTNSVTLTGLTANTQYQVYVRARDAAGNQSANSALATFTTTGGGGGAAACRVAYTISPWGGSNGFTAGVSITNTGTTAINGWTLAFTLPSGQALTPPGWGATWTPSGQNLTAVPLDWNRNLPAGQSISIGFNGTHSGNTGKPTAFTLNGTACTVS